MEGHGSWRQGEMVSGRIACSITIIEGCVLVTAQESILAESAAIRELSRWLEDYLPASVELCGELQLSPLPGDAGFRRYFRVNAEPSLMAVYAPPQHENNPAFVSKALALAGAGVHTPAVHAVDYQRGFMLLEDFGHRMFDAGIQGGDVDALYGQAESTLLEIQRTDCDAEVFGDYNHGELHREMDLFPQWFIGEMLGLELLPEERQLLADTFEMISAEALDQPQVVVHRDYHCRNLMLLDDDGLGVIDFQDGLIGPITYDLVSLLKDCYQRWPTDWVEQRALGFAEQLRQQGQLEGVTNQRFIQWFDWMGLQRHIKVLGIFARLWLRDGKARYLDDLPLVIRYTLEVTNRYPALKGFAEWFERRLLPAIEQQSWYRDWWQAGEK